MGHCEHVVFAFQSWLPTSFYIFLGEIPVHSVSLGILGVQVGLFSTDPFLWTASLRAAKKNNSDKLWVVTLTFMVEE